MALAHCYRSENNVWIDLFFTRAGGVEKEVSAVLVHFCPQVPDMGLLSTMVEDQESGRTHCDGSVHGLDHYHLHCAEHSLHGNGTPAHVYGFQQNTD